MEDFDTNGRAGWVRPNLRARWFRFPALVFVGLVLATGAGLAQDGNNQPLSIRGLTPAGARVTATDAWGTLQFNVTNPNTSGRDARVVVFYPERPEVQYARDIWVPGRSVVTTWLTVGPPPPQKSEISREFQVVLHDRTGGTDTVVLPPGEERVRSRTVLYRRRDASTSILADLGRADPGEADPNVPPDVVTLTRLPRVMASLSEHVSIVTDGPLPLVRELLDGIDVLVVSGNRLAADPPGRAAVRRWVQEGGRLWVMLDRVDPDVIAPLLGSDPGIAVVDRVGLTTLRLRAGVAPPDPVRQVEQPVPFVRVVPSEIDRVLVTTDGWPAAFVRRVGRGKILFTTLGPAGWSQPRGPRVPSQYKTLPDFPTPVPSIVILSNELHSTPEPDPFPPDVFQPMLADEIGYSVVERGTAAVLLGGFVAALASVGILLRRTRRPALVGWLLPLVAIATVGVFVFLGERSRRSIPPTLGIAALVEPIPGRDEAVLTGLYALYHPDSGRVTLGSQQGVNFGLDTEGLEGQLRTRVQTDADAWHWDRLALPAGTRTGALRATLKTGRVTATARFGPNGVEGRFAPGQFQGLSDALVSTQGREALGLRLGPDGGFTLGTADLVTSDDYLPGVVLSDRQQRRHAVYRRLLSGSALRHHEGHDVLLVWADPPDVPIVREEGARLVGGALLAVPIEYDRTPPNTPVTVPRGLSPVKRIIDGKPIPVPASGEYAVDMRLRIQLPPAVLPLRVERVTLFVQARAPFRRLSIAGVRDAQLVPLFQATAPVEPIRIEITDASLLRPDEQGGLFVNVVVSAAAGAPANDSGWKFDSISIEVVGRTEESR